jgi:hypothetical protein
MESWVIETPCLDAQHIRKPLQLHEERASAVWAKATLYYAAGPPAKPMETRFAAQLEGGFQNDNDSRIATAARRTAIAAMTVQHHSRFGIALVANGSASTSTR